MQTIKFSLMALIFLAAFPIWAQWKTVESSTTADLHDISFADSLHGWIVGESATIIKSIDAGETWEMQACPLGAANLNKIFTLNEKVAYILGSSGVGEDIRTFILSTQNGGNNWVVSHAPFEYRIRDLFFINPDTGWAAGGDFLESHYRGFVLKTTDGGSTWQTRFETDTSDYRSEIFSAVSFLNAREGWAFSGFFMDNLCHVHLHKTTDGGAHWDSLSEAPGSFDMIRVVSRDTIWGIGGSLGITNDGGVSWEGLHWPDSYISGFRDIVQIDGQTAWLLARYVGGGNRILYTEDSAGNFSEIFADTTGPYLEAMAILKNQLWVIGRTGTIRYYDIQSNSTVKNINTDIRTFQLYQNYPNPFNLSTTITYYLDAPQYITLCIYNAKGRLVNKLFEGLKDEGTHREEWDGADRRGSKMPSGIYMLVLRSNNRMSKQKMILLQ